MKYLKLAAWILLYLAVYLVAQILVGIVVIIIKLITLPEANTNQAYYELLMNSVYKSIIMVSIIAAVVSFFAYWLIMRLRKTNIFNYCSFSKTGKWNIVLAAIIGVAIVFPIDAFVRLFSIDKLSVETQKIFGLVFEGNSTFLLILGVGMLLPAIEEIIFRGLVLSELRKNVNVIPAVLIQAALFGIYHMNLSQAIYAFIMGIVLGLICIWTKSIWPSMVLHMFFNSTGVALSKIGDIQISNIYIYILIFAGLIISVLSMFYIRKASKNKSSNKLATG